MESLKVDEDELERMLCAQEFHIENASQRALAVKVLSFEDVIESVLSDLFVHKLTDQLYDLSTKMSGYLTDKNNKILGSENMLNRLKLILMVHKVMDQCMDLLGLKSLEKL